MPPIVTNRVSAQPLDIFRGRRDLPIYSSGIHQGLGSTLTPLSSPSHFPLPETVTYPFRPCCSSLEHTCILHLIYVPPCPYWNTPGRRTVILRTISTLGPLDIHCVGCLIALCPRSLGVPEATFDYYTDMHNLLLVMLKYNCHCVHLKSVV